MTCGSAGTKTSILPTDVRAIAKPLSEWLKMDPADFKAVFGDNGDDFEVFELAIGTDLYDKGILGNHLPEIYYGIVVPIITPVAKFRVSDEPQSKRGQLKVSRAEFNAEHKQAIHAARVALFLWCNDYVAELKRRQAWIECYPTETYKEIFKQFFA